MRGIVVGGVPSAEAPSGATRTSNGVSTAGHAESHAWGDCVRHQRLPPLRRATMQRSPNQESHGFSHVECQRRGPRADAPSSPPQRVEQPCQPRCVGASHTRSSRDPRARRRAQVDATTKRHPSPQAPHCTLPGDPTLLAPGSLIGPIPTLAAPPVLAADRIRRARTRSVARTASRHPDVRPPTRWRQDGRAGPHRHAVVRPFLLRYRDVRAEIDVLDSMEQAHAVIHGTTERLAAGNQARAARALVDHRHVDDLSQIGVAG